MVCSYCGTVTLRSGRSEEDFTADLREHIINCDKRPDRQYLNLILSITEPLGIDPGSFAPGDLDSMTKRIAEIENAPQEPEQHS